MALPKVIAVQIAAIAVLAVAAASASAAPGDFTEAPWSPYDANLAQPEWLDTGDFNNDGNTDIAIVDDSGLLTLVLNDSKGEPMSTSALNVTEPTDVVTADFDGNGSDDLATGTTTDKPRVRIFLNDGTPGTVSFTPVDVQVGDDANAIPVSLEPVDLSGTPEEEIVVGTFGGGLTVVNNDGSGSFAAGQSLNVGAGASTREIHALDLGGDDDQDLAILPQNDDTLYLFDNSGGTVSAFGTVNFPSTASGSNPYTVISSFDAGDLDGDNDNDLAATYLEGSSTVPPVPVVRPALNNGSGAFSLGARIVEDGDENPLDISIDNVDSAPGNDLVVGGRQADGTGGSLRIYLNGGSGTFTEAASSPVDNRTTSSNNFIAYLAVDDLDGDGDPDVATSNDTSFETDISLFFNDEDFGGVGGGDGGGDGDGGGGNAPDGDGDGVPDSQDNCPSQAGSGPDGCPPDGGNNPGDPDDGEITDLDATAKKKQKQKGKKIKVKVSIGAQEAISAKATGKIKIKGTKGKFKLKPQTKDVEAGERAVIRLTLAKKKDAKKIKKAIKKYKKASRKKKKKIAVKAPISVTATGTDGDTQTEKRVVTLA